MQVWNEPLNEVKNKIKIRVKIILNYIEQTFFIIG